MQLARVTQHLKFSTNDDWEYFVDQHIFTSIRDALGQEYCYFEVLMFTALQNNPNQTDLYSIPKFCRLE
jgi:hypothetical protein